MSETEVDRLIEKLLKIESLYARPGTPGERQAAEQARDRIRQRLAELGSRERPIEYRFSIHDPWARKLFLALLRRYGLKPYRYPRQHRTTVLVRVTRTFVDETLWPQFQSLDRTLGEWLAEVTEKVIARAVWEDQSEAEEQAETGELPFVAPQP